jgi:hypothetical protein
VTLTVDGLDGLVWAVAIVFGARLAYDVARLLGAALVVSIVKGRLGAKATLGVASVKDRIRDYRRARNAS